MDFATKLHQQLRKDAELRASEIPGIMEELADKLIDRFLPPGYENCKKASCNRADCASRCTEKYWRDHGEVTQALMQRLAKKLGRDERVYGLVGLIHDIDYLKHPHNRPGVDKPHPISLVQALMENSVHPIICMTILEHAPYLRDIYGLPSSPLAAALSACEDLATLLSIKGSNQAIEKLKLASGLVRNPRRPPKRFIDPLIESPRVLNDPCRFIDVPLAMITGAHTFSWDF